MEILYSARQRRRINEAPLSADNFKEVISTIYEISRATRACIHKRVILSYTRYGYIYIL